VSRTDIAEAIFREQPNVWLPWTRFAGVCGQLAWRTRISDCRKRGMDIQNKLVRAMDGTIHSYYRFSEGE